MLNSDLLKVYKNLTKRKIAYMPIFYDITGSVTSAVLLSQIHYWIEEKGYPEFYKTNTEFMKEIRMGEREFKNAKKNLIELGFIECILRGVPAKTYYKLNLENIIQSILDLDESKTAEKSSWYENAQLEEMAQNNSWDETSHPVGTKRPIQLGRNVPTNIDTKITTEITNKPPTPLKGGMCSSKKPKEVLENEFEEVWKEWPLKRSREASKRAYIKSRSLTSQETIINAVRAYKREIEALAQKRKNDIRVFVPSYAHLSTWLNGHRWNDVYESSEAINENDVKKIVEADIESKKEIVVKGLPSQTWQAILKDMATTLGNNTYRSWFMRITPTHFNAGCLYIQAPTRFIKDYIATHLKDSILKTIQSIIPDVQDVEFA